MICIVGQVRKKEKRNVKESLLTLTRMEWGLSTPNSQYQSQTLFEGKIWNTNDVEAVLPWLVSINIDRARREARNWKSTQKQAPRMHATTCKSRHYWSNYGVHWSSQANRVHNPPCVP
uniref:Uncharacterized protein n=1 Tax=Morchella brunnea TaxID=1174671 RepID=A0A8K1I794_9PEZI|nr:hypothetical protein LK370_mgp193 [Morchella brunnea]UBU98367.1 hypothetical protein [Morchella brunnea]